MAMAALPCQKATLGILFTLLHSHRQVRADIVTLPTADAILHTNGLALHPIVQFKHLFGAERDTESATLAPGLMDCNLKLFCQ